MKRALLCIVMLLLPLLLSAQGVDVIVTKGGSRINAIVQEINAEMVVYQLQAEGPYLDIPNSQVAEIRFSTGFNQVFGEDSPIVPFDRGTDEFPGLMSCAKGHLYLNGQIIPENMVWEVTGVPAYWSHYHEYSRKWRAGRSMLYVGIGSILAAGAVCGMDLLRNRNRDITVSEWTTEFAAGLGTIGVCVTGGGIAMIHIGKSRMNELVRRYNIDHRKYPELALGFTSSGAGIALVF